jgi:diketogulonate reductase-like aldo/keto reductase
VSRHKRNTSDPISRTLQQRPATKQEGERKPASDLTLTHAPKQEVADQLGVTPPQVAIAWIRSRSRAIHPIIGARRLDQLVENLGALTVSLPSELVARLDTATDFEIGWEANFINWTTPFVYSEVDTDLTKLRDRRYYFSSY